MGYALIGDSCRQTSYKRDILYDCFWEHIWYSLAGPKLEAGVKNIKAVPMPARDCGLTSQLVAAEVVSQSSVVCDLTIALWFIQSQSITHFSYTICWNLSYLFPTDLHVYPLWYLRFPYMCEFTMNPQLGFICLFIHFWASSIMTQLLLLYTTNICKLGSPKLSLFFFKAILVVLSLLSFNANFIINFKSHDINRFLEKRDH